jgi:hypothetical protein
LELSSEPASHEPQSARRSVWLFVRLSRSRRTDLGCKIPTPPIEKTDSQ